MEEPSDKDILDVDKQSAQNLDLEFKLICDECGQTQSAPININNLLDNYDIISPNGWTSRIKSKYGLLVREDLCSQCSAKKPKVKLKLVKSK